jgi:hypothetical protein
MLARIKPRTVELEMAFGRGQIDDDRSFAVAEAFLERSVGPDIVKSAEFGKPLRIVIPDPGEAERGMIGKRRHVVVGDEPRADKCDLGHGSPGPGLLSSPR